MRQHKGSNVALVALISLVVGASYHRLWRLAKQPTTTQWVTHARAKARPAPRTFGHPTAGDPRGRAGRAPLSHSGTRRRIKELGAWETVASASRPYEFCESSKATYKDLIYVVGGFLCDFNRVTDKIQMLNTTSGVWKTVAYLPATAAKTHHGAAVSRDGTWLYLVSGQLGPGCTLGTAESWAVRFVGRRQTKKAVWVRLPDLPEVRYAPSAFVDGNTLHVIGGAGPNRRDPRPDHYVLPLNPSGRPSKSGWFRLGAVPGGGADSAGAAVVRGHAYRFGGQHGHPPAVNVLVDNNQQCQSSPEVAHVQAYRRPLSHTDGVKKWAPVAPLPWPASHIGLSTVSVGDDVLIVSGKDGKETTSRIAAYDVVTDTWRELRSLDWGQPDFLAYVSQGYLNALKFKWHPTNSTLDDDYKSIWKRRNNGELKKFPWPRAFSHQRAKIVYEQVTAPRTPQKRFDSSEVSITPLPGSSFGARIAGVDLASLLPEPPAAFGKWLRETLDTYAVLHFIQKSGLDAKQVVAFHALFEHDIEAPPDAYHKGMCRLWRAGLPEVNLLANRAVTETQTVSAGALGDDGEPCKEGQVYGMESLAWHSDESSRPAGLPVRTTVFQALKAPTNSDAETHFADGRLDSLSIDAKLKRRLLSLNVTYASNAKSLDAFMAPWAVAGRKDMLVRQGGFSKDPSAGQYASSLIEECSSIGGCVVHDSPLISKHPRTGKAALHLDVKQQLGLRGVPFAEAQNLLEQVVGKAAHPSKVYRHRWAAHDVVVTDNYAALHTAAPGKQFNSEPRLIQRVCVPGGHVPESVL
ncbi:unnamed protein product [Pelagomonas calceolata]|uniref:TauD/TfdA-like domain-containing protein n=1 Tax=Pelagomonas calceolata TaxID=35677 RepID=A0A8J2X2M6_9STRA|nr:unnamed protein product [Pelagomonas calceolata]|mmetsp:Transcript_13432/g.39782  ORF Transcript_13432/g.39782 Transcript_13432/m.39782 type:complete len:803 (-) Transcript_13432:5530-7938(-)